MFVLSDGESSDGDPVPVAREMLDKDVTIVTRFLTANDIRIPKRLVDDGLYSDGGASKLLEMSSVIPNYEAPASYFIDAGWELPTSGESRLFLQANSLDVVNEFCKIVFNHVVNQTCVDTFIDILGTVSLAHYINVTNAEVKPKTQIGETCCANAIAAVYHLAMRRIVGREGGIPSFYKIRQELLRYPPNVKVVINKTHQKYRLRFREIENNKTNSIMFTYQTEIKTKDVQ